jgi:hypothetical protein
MELRISDPERELLVRILNSAVGDVRSQVRRTHSPEWHDGLKEEETVMKGLLRKLGGK